MQTTKPQTLSFALNDSPVGLCAWILEKRRTWSDCNGDVEKRFSKDDLCTTMTLYWATQSFGTSARYYYEATHNPWKPSHEKTPIVQAPTGVAVFFRRSYSHAAQMGRRVLQFTTVDVHAQGVHSGGHFAPMEEPELLVDDIRAFFRSLRA